MKPLPGTPAPDFTAPVVGGGYPEDAVVTLNELRGRRVVLVFYPKDLTPGCTTQACALRDGWNGLEGKAAVFGVSIDPPASHRKFIDKMSLPFPLISDPDKEIVTSYGVWVEKSMYGKKYMGTERSTFVIDPEGVVEKVFEKVSPKEHFDLISAYLGAG